MLPARRWECRRDMTARRAYHHGDLANALVAVALELIEEQGLEEFSLREAAARCGVAVSSAYKHYASRRELLQAVGDRGFHELAALMERRVKAATRGLAGTRRAEEQLYQIGRQYILFAVARPNLFKLMYGPTGSKGGSEDRRPNAPARRVGQLLLGALAEVRTAYGHTGTTLEQNMVVAWGLVHGFSVMVIDGVWKPKDQKVFHAMIAELGQAVLRSLRTPA
jgi:AcrR family transcriptional regulator